MIYGRTQSGKTREACTEICKSIQIYNCPGLFIVRALKGERSSQTTALSKFAREIDPEIEVIEVNAADDSTVFQLLQQAIRVDTPRKNKSLFILMGNDTTLRRATNQLRDNDRLRYLVALDEADIGLDGGPLVLDPVARPFPVRLERSQVERLLVAAQHRALLSCSPCACPLRP